MYLVLVVIRILHEETVMTCHRHCIGREILLDHANTHSELQCLDDDDIVFPKDGIRFSQHLFYNYNIIYSQEKLHSKSENHWQLALVLNFFSQFVKVTFFPFHVTQMLQRSIREVIFFVNQFEIWIFIKNNICRSK